MSYLIHESKSRQTASTGRLDAPRIEHSLTTATRHRQDLRLWSTRASRSLLSEIFFCQNSVRVLGSRKSGQSWPCQKQPWKSMTTRCLGKMISGFPGSSRACSRNRSPKRWSPDRSRISGLVFFPRMPDIMRLRVSEETVSAIYAAKSLGIPASASLSESTLGSMACASVSKTGTATAFPNCL